MRRRAGRPGARGGVFAVLGDHDWWLDAPPVRAALERASIPVLDDAATPIALGDCRFWLDFARGFRDVPPDATVLFTHNPDVFPEIPARVSLTVAGHTHGGQVYLPGIGRPVVPSQYGERFAIGHAVENGRHLFVSSGLGTRILPVRFLVPPEVSVLSLDASAGTPTRAAP